MNHAFDLSQRVALITGGSKGLGKAMARGFAEAGANVIITSRHESELQTAARDISQGLAAQVKYLVADMTDRPAVERMAQEARALFGKVDILVNNAGNNLPEELIEITDEKWDTIFELNVTSCMVMSRALAPGMKERGWGRIIYLSSVMAIGSNPGRSSYSASKAALMGMCRAQALELGPYGITVNCLAPGPFLTDLPINLLSEEQKQSFAKRTGLLRWGEPRELAGPALLLASDAGSYITGHTLQVDGGLLCRTF
ncbi:MAG TPA: SDR family oxidoreductase [Pirellulales bacterium]|jgi:NAD(P)-dependent dehydrogenase (short-subunit alcohol dehydrogenase family)|nr:SDR family oxidoreductase [Pirellulales bacterium]